MIFCLKLDNSGTTRPARYFSPKPSCATGVPSMSRASIMIVLPAVELYSSGSSTSSRRFPKRFFSMVTTLRPSSLILPSCELLSGESARTSFVSSLIFPPLFCLSSPQSRRISPYISFAVLPLHAVPPPAAVPGVIEGLRFGSFNSPYISLPATP